jgi:hypothetical protein
MRNKIKLLAISFILSIFIWNQALAKEVPIESLLPQKLPEGWRQIGSPQVCTRKTLFNRINGQAELFFKYGFQKSVFSIYQDEKNSKDQIDLDLYDMGNTLQAFGIFSRFRSEDHSAGVGSESYIDDTSLLFYRGRYFVMLYATEADSSVLSRLAKTISSGIPDSSPSPKEIDYFPKAGLKPGSIEYYPEGLLGYQFFKRGFKGVYLEKAEDEKKGDVETKGRNKDRAKKGRKEFKLFLAIFEDSQKANNALKDFKDNLSQKGKVSPGSIIAFKTRVLKGEDPYQGKVMVVQKGFYLLGVAGFEKEEDGEHLLAEFMREVK